MGVTPGVTRGVVLLCSIEYGIGTEVVRRKLYRSIEYDNGYNFVILLIGASAAAPFFLRLYRLKRTAVYGGPAIFYSCTIILRM
jgi:hypothetical protein